MRKRDANGTELDVRAGEIITIEEEVVRGETVRVLDDAELPGDEFSLTADQSPAYLDITCTYSALSGDGWFEVTLEGDPEEDTSVRKETQQEGDPMDTLSYTFYVSEEQGEGEGEDEEQGEGGGEDEGESEGGDEEEGEGEDEGESGGEDEEEGEGEGAP